jgi:signal transduction histidine kinase
MRYLIRIEKLFLALLMVLSAAVYGQPAIAEQDALDTAVARAVRSAGTDMDQAILQLNGIYEQSRQKDYAYGMLNALLSAGSLYVRGEGQAAPAMPYFLKARAYLAKAAVKNEGVYARWYTCMGAVHIKTGNIDSAMHYYSLAQHAHLKQKKTDYAALEQNYRNLVVLYFEMEQYDNALYYTRKSIALCLQHNFRRPLLNSYTMTAGAFFELKQFDSAAFYLDKAMATGVKPNEIEQKLLYEMNGLLYLNKKMPDKAIPFFLSALSVNAMSSPTSLRGLGNAYIMKGNYVLAEEYLDQAMDVMRTQFLGAKSMVVGIHNDLAALYDSTGNYRDAYTHRSQAAILQKELSDKDRAKMINQLETKYRSAEKDKQLSEKQVALLSVENDLRAKNFWIAVVVVVALSLAIFVLVLYQKHKTQVLRSSSLVQQQEIEKLRAVIDAEEKERSRIGRELHDDIMVQLSIIKMNMEALPSVFPPIKHAEDYINIKEQLNNAGRDIRQTAHNLIPDTLLAEGLVQALMYFCSNVQRRTGINVNFQYYGNIAPLNAQAEISLYRIAQELLQNVIKHAAATTVLVQLNYREDMVTLTVEDDGKGIPASQKTAGDGMGLKSIEGRLKAINGSIDIHSRKPNGTSVTIEINV